MKKIYLVAMGLALVLAGCGKTDAAVVEDQTAKNETENASVEKSEEMADEDMGEIVVVEENAKENTEDEDEAEAEVRSYQEAYKEIIEAFQAENEEAESEYCKLGYNLIDFNGDDIPELVYGLNGYYISMCTCENGEIKNMIDQWPYGAFGNAGYEYLPGEGIIRNYNSDYAGAEIWEWYGIWNSEKGDFDDALDDSLVVKYFIDANGDGVVDGIDLNYDGYTEEPHYYYGENNEVSQEEYESHQIKGDYQWIEGSLTYEEIMQKLN